MELTLIVGSLVAFAIASVRFGFDSRDWRI